MSAISLNPEILSAITGLLNKMSFKDVKLDKNFGLVKFYAGTHLDGNGDPDVEECDDILRHNLYHLAKLVANVKMCVINLTQHGLISMDTHERIYKLKPDLLMSVGMWCEIVKMERTVFPTVMKEIFGNFENERICALLALHCHVKATPRPVAHLLNSTNNISVTPQPVSTVATAELRPVPASAPPATIRMNGMDPSGDWSCIACTYRNLTNSNSCTLCYSQRLENFQAGGARTTDILVRSPVAAVNAEIAAGAAAAAAVTSGWSCTHCTFHNVPNTAVCSMCCKTKESGLGFEVAVSPEVAVGLTKTCRICTMKNDVGNRFCDVCNGLFPIPQAAMDSDFDLNNSSSGDEPFLGRFPLIRSSDDISSDEYE